MKTIEINDDDYKDLMDLIKEYKTQENDAQAFPRMWTVECTHERVTAEGYGNTYEVVVDRDGENSIKLEELYNILLKYYEENGFLDGLDWEYESYLEDVDKFKDWCYENDTTIYDVLTEDSLWNLQDYLNSIDSSVVCCEEYKYPELNATFFKSDAKKHIEINGHNLSKNPHTYAFTPHRMPKMHRLIKILMKLDGSNDNAIQ